MRLNRSGNPLLHSHPGHTVDVVGMLALRPPGDPVVMRVEELFDHTEHLPVERLKRNAATAPVPVNNDSGHVDLLPMGSGHKAEFNLYARADRQKHNACLDEQALQADVSAPAQDHGMAFEHHLHLERNRLA